MRRLFRGSVALGSVIVTAGSLGSGLAVADETAVIVPGTGPSEIGAFQDLAADYDYATMPIRIGENFYSPTTPRRMVQYPASVWPFSGLDTKPIGVSVATGADNLDAEIRNTDGQIVVPALSQGAMVVDAEKARLAKDPNAPARDRLRFIQAGNPNALAQNLFPAGTYLPVLEYTVPARVDSQYDTVMIKSEYDVWADPPDRMDNILAVANSIMAGQYDHTATAFLSPTDFAPGDVSTTVNSRGATTTTYFLPKAELPLTKPLRDMGISREMVDQIDTVLRPMIDSAYYRHTPASATEARPVSQPTIKLSGTDQANVEKAAEGFKLSATDQANIDKAVQGVKLSPTDQANIDKAVQGVKLSPTDQANIDNAAQQVKNLFPGIG
ncbi:hypothetical protein BVU76_06845 [Mycolicibacterium porcinum]|nr:hypothetical protein BVU76_06845 [Mycolicibacterium porcinum]